MLNGAAVSWKSQRQQTLALSTSEAECMALIAVTQEGKFLKQLLHEFHEDPPEYNVRMCPLAYR
jgi:hypothetical protein